MITTYLRSCGIWDCWGRKIAEVLGIPHHTYVYVLVRKLGLRRRSGRSLDERYDKVVEVVMNSKLLMNNDAYVEKQNVLLSICVKRKKLKKVCLINSRICKEIFNNGICGKTIYYLDDNVLIESLLSKLKITNEASQSIGKSATHYLKDILPMEISSAIIRVYR